MTREVAEVLETARSLERDQIADLAYQLLRVLDAEGDQTAQESVDAAWHAEFGRRIDDIESGEVELVDGRETLALVRAALAARSG